MHNLNVLSVKHVNNIFVSWIVFYCLMLMLDPKCCEANPYIAPSPRFSLNFRLLPNYFVVNIISLLLQGKYSTLINQCIGTEGYGTVYKAELPNGRVVVKKLNYSSDQHGGDMADFKAFKSEIHALTQIRHRNIVKLYGFSSFAENSFLIYEFI